MRRPSADPPVRCMPPIGLSPAPSFRIRHAHHPTTAADSCDHHAVSFCPRQYKTYINRLFPGLDPATTAAAAAMSAGPAAAAAATAADDHSHGAPPTTSSTTHTTQKQPQLQSSQTQPPPQQQRDSSTLVPLPPIMQLPPRDSLPELPQVGSDRAWVTVKIVFRSLCLCIGLSLCAIAIASFAPPFPIGVPIVVLTMGLIASLWNAAEFITMCTRGSRRRGITAKAHVGCELILWMFSVTGAVIQGIALGWPLFTPTGAVCVALLGTLGILEFVLFVRSCVEVDRRKKDQRIQQLVIALQMQQQRNLDLRHQQQLGQGQQQKQAVSSPSTEAATSSWRPAPSSSDYSREFNTKYYGPMPEPLDDPRDLQKVLIIDPRLRG